MDIAAQQHRTEAFAAIDPMRRLPVLVVDDGTVIAESIAICRYFEALQARSATVRPRCASDALVEMWNGRAELNLMGPVTTVFQHLHPFMKPLVNPPVPAWGEANKLRVLEFLKFLDGELKNRPYVAGSDFTVADITALTAVDFMKVPKLVVPEELVNLRRWRVHAIFLR